MAYAVGHTIEVCLECELPPARGVRCVVATFENERGDEAEFTEVPAGASECVVQEPTQIGLQGKADYPGSYELKRLRVEHLGGVTHVDPPQIGFEVRGTPEVASWGGTSDEPYSPEIVEGGFSEGRPNGVLS